MRGIDTVPQPLPAHGCESRFQQELVTTNQFFDVLAATQLVRAREAGVRRADEQLKVSVARLRAGAAIRSDSLRALVTLGTARVQLINAETQLLWSSDYPHWDFDLPSTIYDLPFLSEKAKRNILGENARRLFKL